MLWYRCTLNREKKSVNIRRLYLCVLGCVADRVIWDFLLSLTVTTIGHVNLCLVRPRRNNHRLHIVANAAPTFFTVPLSTHIFLPLYVHFLFPPETDFLKKHTKMFLWLIERTLMSLPLLDPQCCRWMKLLGKKKIPQKCQILEVVVSEMMYFYEESVLFS